MAESEVKIRITGDEKPAVGALGRVVTALRGVRTAVGRVMSAFGLFGLAVQGVQMLVDGYRKLQEWAGRAARAARELADQLERDSIATRAAHAAEDYKKLNKELAESNRLAREQNAILDARKATERDLEDANAERGKQMAVAALDPNSATYAEDRAAIERRYAREASTRAAARAEEDSRAGARRLYGEADRLDADAAQQQRAYERQMRIVERTIEQRNGLGMRARRGEEGAQEKLDAANAEYDRQLDAAQKIKEAMEALRREADSLRERAGEMAGGGRAARIRDEAEQQRITNEERDAQARADQRRQEEEARAAREAARQADAEARERARQAEADAAARHTNLLRIGDADGVSANRLTAMGLGSGVTATGGVAGDVKKIVDLLKQEIEATKNIRPGETGTAVWGE